MSTTPRPWSVVRTEQVADYRIFRIERISATRNPGDAPASFVRVHSPDWVNIIAVSPNRHIALVQQYRHGTQSLTWEIPGGMIDAGEQPLSAGVRELAEETGIAAPLWVRLGSVDVNPAFMSNRCHTFLAWDATVTSDTRFDEHEELLLRWIPWDQTVQMLRDGSLNHGVVVAAFAFWAAHFNGFRMPDPSEVRALLIDGPTATGR